MNINYFSLHNNYIMEFFVYCQYLNTITQNSVS